ncbi:MAG: sigma 54-interacting transcriptional regulator [Thermodesulfobacteriota bacterium]|nr:sigma 54-interacting transcriptional regulator [Thermodesulfobacteriota bacterium]
MKDDSPQTTMSYLQTIFDRSADGLMICDAKGKILKLNKAAEILNGIKASEVQGKNVRTLVKQRQIDRSATQEVLDTKRQVSVIQTTPRSEYTLLVTGTPVFDDQHNISFVVINERDMSLIKSMREELAIARLESEKIKDELTELTLLELKQNNIVAKSDSMKQTLRLALKLSAISASNILIQGESGTGKGLLAKFIHKYSAGGKKPFIQINCAALPENLLEAELFGYTRGAFTGASENGKIGLFELACGGTLFLDEIGEMPVRVQAKLLKCLDDHEIMPIGGIVPKKINCLIIAATNRNLDTRTMMKKFRLDLLHRLNTFTLSIPPLRNRPEDILELVRITLKKYNKQYNRRTRIGYKTFDMLQAYDFPGNVRELINIIKQAIVMSDRRSLDDYLMSALGKTMTDQKKSHPMKNNSTLAEKIWAAENEMLTLAAEKCRSTREAAGFLGISQPSVVRKFKKHGISITKKHC